MSSSPSSRAKSPAPEKPLTIEYEGEMPGATRAFAIDLYEDGYDDPLYQEKARILNRSIQEIGMGKYQVCRETDA